MNVPNHDKVAFKDMTPEERSEIVEAWLAGGVEYYYGESKWKFKPADSSLFGGTVYRTRQRKLTIPWEHIKPEYKWAAMDGDGELYFYTGKPYVEEDGGEDSFGTNNSPCNRGVILSIDTTGIDWRESLTKRPEGV